MLPMKSLIGIGMMVAGLVAGFGVPLGEGLIQFTLFDSAVLCAVFGGIVDAFGGDTSICAIVNGLFGATVALAIGGMVLTIWGLKRK